MLAISLSILCLLTSSISSYSSSKLSSRLVQASDREVKRVPGVVVAKLLLLGKHISVICFSFIKMIYVK